ncbi:MAG TPA: pentapeptide repeat-containing protein [Candidatus Acidoferrales bacterium]|nr:pentapeptide repeat-containing protein [Candidatus Acidoferrales bacterium]
MAIDDPNRHIWSENDTNRLREREVVAEEKEAEATTKEAEAADRGVGTAERSVETQKHTVVVQVIALLFAAVATAAAAFAALQAGNAVRASENIASQQALENRLAMAITSIGQRSPADQVAGLTLLRRNVESRINQAMQDPNERTDAYETYATSLGLFDVYFRTTIRGDEPSIAAIYAADELQETLNMASRLKAIDDGKPLYIDLSKVTLPGVNWTSVRFDSLTAAWMPGIDLKGADLANSHWGHATMTGANLQCADLEGADLRLASLSGADLHGADLRGAQLPPLAMRQNMITAGAVGPVQGLTIVDPGSSYNPNSCRNANPRKKIPKP